MESSQSSNDCDGSDSQLDCDNFEIEELSNTSTEKDDPLYETTLKLIQEEKFDSLKVDMCKSYLRHHGLRLSGKKSELISRIQQHQLVINDLESVKKTFCPSTFSINCQGDVCQGDVVLFKQKVFDGYAVEKRGGQNCLGLRTIIGKIVNDNYGLKKQQHTFTIDVIYSFGIMPLPPLKQLLIKGRNLYRIQTFRRPWEDERQRFQILNEKHERGFLARKVKRGEMRNSLMKVILKNKRIVEKENAVKSKLHGMEDAKKEKGEKGSEKERNKRGREKERAIEREEREKEKEKEMEKENDVMRHKAAMHAVMQAKAIIEKDLKNLDLNLNLNLNSNQTQSQSQSHSSNSFRNRNANLDGASLSGTHTVVELSLQRNQVKSSNAVAESTLQRNQVKSSNAVCAQTQNGFQNAAAINSYYDAHNAKWKDYANLIQQNITNKVMPMPVHPPSQVDLRPIPNHHNHNSHHSHNHHSHHDHHHHRNASNHHNSSGNVTQNHQSRHHHSNNSIVNNFHQFIPPLSSLPLPKAGAGVVNNSSNSHTVNFVNPNLIAQLHHQTNVQQMQNNKDRNNYNNNYGHYNSYNSNSSSVNVANDNTLHHHYAHSDVHPTQTQTHDPMHSHKLSSHAILERNRAYLIPHNPPAYIHNLCPDAPKN